MPKLLLSLILLLCSVCLAGTLPPGFDPERHMLVSEVKPGMTGYGLSVFSGTKIDRFDVKVISILRNFNPRNDVVLIRATGANLEHTGAIAGMSGSPIYLTDESGKSRLIGAFAYGWPMMKDSLAGVQPIEYMLALDPAKRDGGALASADGASVGASGEWSVLSSFTRQRQELAARREPAPSATTSLRRLAIPLSVGGMSASAVEQLAPLFPSADLTPMQSSGGSSDKPIRLEPGSAMAVPLLVGDIDMTAVGTCTEVIDGKAYGFGHPFTGTGNVELPMCAGEIQGIIANLVTSFKLGSASGAVGTLLADGSSGVAGRVGEVPGAAPMHWRVRYADGSLDQDFNFRAVIHPQFTPALTTTAAFGAISASRQLPHYNTVDYNVTVAFSDGHEVKLADRLVNVDPQSLFSEIGMPISAASENPFGKVLVKSIEGDIVIGSGAASAELLHVGSPRQVYRPGETVRFFATLRPFRSVDLVKELQFELPQDLADGNYKLVVSEAQRFLSDEQAASPFRFTASKVDDVFTALNDLSTLRCDALYLRLTRTTEAVAVGRTSLPGIPSTHRQMLLAAGRSDVVAYTPCIVKQIPTEWVLSGEAELQIQVSRTGKPASAAH